MPEIVIEDRRLLTRLSPVERLLKSIEAERELIEFHERKRREAAQRLRDYRRELAKHSGGAIEA